MITTLFMLSPTYNSKNTCASILKFWDILICLQQVAISFNLFKYFTWLIHCYIPVPNWGKFQHKICILPTSWCSSVQKSTCLSQTYSVKKKVIIGIVVSFNKSFIPVRGGSWLPWNWSHDLSKSDVTSIYLFQSSLPRLQFNANMTITTSSHTSNPNLCLCFSSQRSALPSENDEDFYQVKLIQKFAV